MERRTFIEQLAVGSTLVASGLSLPAFSSSSRRKKITILHTNDVHSQIDPFVGGRYDNKGGVARRATLIESFRDKNPNTLLLDAGDMFQGTPYFNYYGGELEFKLMSKLKYDAATIGNHDFDNGIDGLYAQLPNASFDLLSANYDFSNTILDTHIQPYKIFDVEDIKVGVFGIGIKLDGLVLQKLYKETKYLDPIEISQDMTRILKEEKGCDLIICLSHLGYHYRNDYERISDLKLASLTKNIDLIIGGHTHTFLPKPTIAKNIEGLNMLVNQVGAYGVYLGKIDFYFDSDKNKSSEGTTIIV